MTDWILTKDKLKIINKFDLERGLEIIVNFGAIIFLTLGISFLTRSFVDTTIGMFIIGSLRVLIDGHHLSSSDLCVLYSVLLIFTSLPFIGKWTSKR